jgi:hypothetical protein
VKAVHGKHWGKVLYDATQQVSSDDDEEYDGEASGTGGREDSQNGY